ncbi:MAG: metallophosphoesterase [Pseudobdellovibrionaceae bacterium]
MFHISLRSFLSVLFITGFGLFVQASSRMAIMGDAGLWGPPLDHLRRSLELANTRSVIMPGDNLYFGSYSVTWDIWKKTGFSFDVVALGNHNKGYPTEMLYFNMPGEYFSVVKNGARFFVLNSDNTNNEEQQFAWLEQEFSKATEKLIFIVYHHPTFTVSEKHKWTEKKDFQLRMREFLKVHAGKITALIIGHDHISTLVDFGSVPAILAGAGREVRSAQPVSYIEDGFAVETRFLDDRTQHWAQLEISEDASEAWVHWIRVSDQSNVCSAHLVAGRMRLDAKCR